MSLCPQCGADTKSNLAAFGSHFTREDGTIICPVGETLATPPAEYEIREQHGPPATPWLADITREQHHQGIYVSDFIRTLPRWIIRLGVRRLEKRNRRSRTATRDKGDNP